MTDERLIEEAREAVGVAKDSIWRTSPDADGDARHEAMLDRMLAVFEKVNSPTDDFPHGHPEIAPADEEREASLEDALTYLDTLNADRQVWYDDYRNLHDLVSSALRRTEPSKPGEHGGTIPLYGMVDVWMALYGTSHPEFDEFYAEHGYADTWARILDAVRRRRSEVPEPSDTFRCKHCRHCDAKPVVLQGEPSDAQVGTERLGGD